jgi:hypothetical protein
MRKTFSSLTMVLCVALATVALSAGCESDGTYRVSWSFSGDDGEILSAADCSRRGVERVVITLVSLSTGLDVKSSVHPCREADSGKLSVGEGTYLVRVQAYGGSNQPFLDPVTGEEALVETVAELRVTGSGVAEVAVVFTPNPECADGVDNDADGLVDAADPGCRNKNGDYDPTVNDEVNDDSNATLEVTWSIHGDTPCGALQPDGAVQASLLVDNLEVGIYPCDDLSGQVPLVPGPHTVSMQLLDASAIVLATTPTQNASLVGGLSTDLTFAFTLDTFDPPQTGELSFEVSWIAAGQTCSDASPVVAEQSLWLQDADGVTVDALTWAGTTVDNTAASVGQCLDASEVQGLTTYVPAGDYTLSISGHTAGGATCWDATSIDVTVGIGPAAAPLELVVPQTDATGLCAP